MGPCDWESEVQAKRRKSTRIRIQTDSIVCFFLVGQDLAGATNEKSKKFKFIPVYSSGCDDNSKTKLGCYLV